MTSALRAGGVAIAAIAISVGLSGCGSGTTSAPSTSKQTASASATTTGKAAPTTPAQAAGPNETIADYISENNITETTVHKGDPGAPTIVLPVPPGWQDAGPSTPRDAYSAMLFSDPAMAQDPPTIIASVSKLTGNVDPAKILQFAPGEIKNLPGYDGPGDGQTTKFAGFDAIQIGGRYTKDGVKRVIAQKTVVIPGKDGVYGLQLNAKGTEDQMGVLMDATGVIDDQTTITP